MIAQSGRQPRRLLMSADTVGGVWQYAIELAKGLSGCGIDVLLATMGRPMSSAQRRLAKSVPSLLVAESTFRLEWMSDCEADLVAAGEWLLELEARFRPDIVHLNGFAHAVLPRQAPCVVVAHSCVRSWWRAVWRNDPPREWEQYRRRVENGLAAADLVVAPTHAYLHSLQSLYGPLSRTCVILNGRNPLDFVVEEKESFIFAAGRIWDEAKNIGILDRIAGQLAWPVYVAGDYSAPDGRAAISTTLRCLGPIDAAAMARRYARAAIFAAPARYEPFGLAALEAGLSGCALVLGDIPTLRELWTGAAIFVAPDDQEGLLRALRDLIGDPARREALGRMAHDRARTFTTQRMTDSYYRAYCDLLAGMPADVQSGERKPIHATSPGVPA